MKPSLQGMKWLFSTGLILLALVACSKNEVGENPYGLTAEEQTVMASSSFYPGETAAGANRSLATSSGETGFIPKPGGTAGGSDSGTIPAPGSGSASTTGGAPSGSTSSSPPSGGTTGGTTTGASSPGTPSGSTGGTASNGGASSTPSGTTSPPGSGSPAGSDGGVIAGNPGNGSDTGSVPSGSTASSGSSSGGTAGSTGSTANTGTTTANNTSGSPSTGTGSSSSTSNGSTSSTSNGSTSSNGSDGGSLGTGSSSGNDGGKVTGLPPAGGSDGGSTASGSNPSPSGSTAGSSSTSSSGNTASNPSGSASGNASAPGTSPGNDGGVISGGGKTPGSDSGTVAQNNPNGGSDSGTTGSPSNSGSSSGGSTSGSGSSTNPPAGSTAGSNPSSASSNPPSGSTGGNPGNTGSDKGTVANNTGNNASDSGSKPSLVDIIKDIVKGIANVVAGNTTPSTPGTPSTGQNSGTTSNPSNTPGASTGGTPNGTDQGKTNPPTTTNGKDNGSTTTTGNNANKEDKKMNVTLSRVCSQARSEIPYPKFVFFEEAKHPILSLEAMLRDQHFACESRRQSSQWAAVGYYPPNYKSSPQTYQVESTGGRDPLLSFLLDAVDLSGVNLLEAKFKQALEVGIAELKKDFPRNWRDILATARVCDDTNHNGRCSDEKAQNILSLAAASFTLDHVPASFPLDVWTGRYFTLKGDPDICEKQYSPLLLDLSGAGFQLSGPEKGTYFDLNDTGQRIATGWPAANHLAFLVRDVNSNGRVDSGAEMFGSATRLANGQRAPNGFEALRELDSNKDGKFTTKDEAWKTLRLWIDANHNGISDRGELFLLDRYAIKEISLNYLDVMEVDPHGNQTRQRATFKREVNGKLQSQLVIDVWFNTLVSQ